MIDAKEVKPSEIMAAVLARIEKLNPELNAFCTIKKLSRGGAKGCYSAFPCPLKI
jgi:Asp-tRNA(Asn)/Glu-tRNA(Gln) amidotransferase A subunit family amidase